MLIGGHVSTAGGLATAVERGIDRDCDSIQIFHQSPRAWRPTAHGAEELARFSEAMASSRLAAVVIHAIYLINCASREREIRRKSLASLKHALRLGEAIGATGVVLHPGARKGEPHEPAMARSAAAVREALEDSERCPLLLENTAGAQGLLGRNFAELAELIELAGGGDRLGACLDCCHLFASGYEIRAPSDLGAVLEDFDARLGIERLGCVHVNDSKVPLGANRDRHANLGEGELGERGIRTFLSEPRFEGLPALLEVPGPDGHGPDREQIAIAHRLRGRGIDARKRGAARKPSARKPDARTAKRRAGVKPARRSSAD